MRKKISGWARNFYSAKKKNKQYILDQIQILEGLRDERDLSSLEYNQWVHLKTQLDDIYLEEERYWHLRAKQQWLKEGDSNTKYFHRVASTRHRKNKILALEIDNSLTTSTLDIHDHIQQFYKNLLGVEGYTFGQIGEGFWDTSDTVSAAENSILTAPFSLEEIHTAVFGSVPHGAPGPDGFTFLFYQVFWDVIQPDLHQLCNTFHCGNLDMQFLNKSIICLIPKEPDAQVITKFRPISLVNCSFKIISKLLTN